jgi:hypothetical protein
MDALLEYLGEEKFNGYVALHKDEDGRGSEGLLLLRGGQVIGASYGEYWGDDAQERIGERVAGQAGKLDIISLPAETVGVLAPSFGSRKPYTDLHTFYIDLDKLVTYLSGIGFSGSINVVGQGGRGTALMSGGRVVGFFTDGSPTLSADPDSVKAIWADGESAIWVSSVQI